MRAPDLAKGALLALIAVAQAAQASEPPKTAAPPGETPRNTDVEAKRLFLRGIELADRGVWAEALEAFRGSLALAVRPSTVFNVGNALYRLGRTREAIESFRRYLEVSDPKADRKMRDRTQELLKVSLATLVSFELTLSPEDAVVKVDGAPEPGRGKSRLLVLDAGQHRIEVAAEGWVSSSFDVSAGSGEKIARTVALAREIREGTLVVAASVEDAMITVDAKSEGIGQVELKLAPGRHVVEVEAKGYASSKQEVKIERGARSELHVTLVALPPPLPAEEPGLLSRPVFWIVAGAVVAAAAGTAAVLVVTRSEDPTYSGTLVPWIIDFLKKHGLALMHRKGSRSEATNRLENLVCGLRPLEGRALVVVDLDVLHDRGAKLDSVLVRASPKSVFCQQAEEPFDEI